MGSRSVRAAVALAVLGAALVFASGSSAFGFPGNLLRRAAKGTATVHHPVGKKTKTGCTRVRVGHGGRNAKPRYKTVCPKRVGGEGATQAPPVAETPAGEVPAGGTASNLPSGPPVAAPESPAEPDQATKDRTALVLSCSGPVEEGEASTCAAKLTDSAATRHGTLNAAKVTFTSSPTSGAFAPKAKCTPAGSAALAECSVAYTAAGAGTVAIRAHYAGDAKHEAAESPVASVVTTAPAPPGEEGTEEEESTGGGGEGPQGKLPSVPAGDELVDLITKNGYEDGIDPTSGPGRSADGSVAGSATDPIEGAASLAMEVNAFGRVGFYYEYGWEQGPLADSVTSRTKLRIDSTTGGANDLELCTIVYFVGAGDPSQKCEALVLTNHSVVEPFLTFEAAGKRIQRAYLQFELRSSGSVNLTLDDSHLFVVRKEDSEGTGGGGGGGGEGGGGGGGGEGGGGGGSCHPASEPAPVGPPNVNSPCDQTEVVKSSPYTPTPVQLPAQHPYVSLDSYKQIAESNPIFQKFKSFVNAAVEHGEFASEYSAAFGDVMFARTGQAKYVEDSIKRVQKQVEAGNAAIAAGKAPTIAGDDFLEIGPELEEVALTYDWGFNLLTSSQKTEWLAYGEKVLSNLWSPRTSTWGGTTGSGEWAGWAINDPGDNYYYSFIEATQMWALATHSTPWIEFLQTYKFPQAEAYYSQFPGGGSREGTGYGVAQRRLWENARIWTSSTGEHLPTIENHARESIEYWVNATVPTLNYFAPIGDESRVSEPEIYDYHVDLMHEAVGFAGGTPNANLGLWWLQHDKHGIVEGEGQTETGEIPRFRGNLLQALIVGSGTPTAPTALSYHASGAGQFFGRSSWSEDATWFQLTAGPYDQSHAHEDQGGFTLYRHTWLAVTGNIWSQSGLQGGGGGSGNAVGDLGTGVNNVVRFEKGGRVIGQNHSVSTETSETKPDGTIAVSANLAPAYSTHPEVKAWNRTVELHGNDFKVHDTCQVESGVSATFQLQVPVAPAEQSPGVWKAGALKVNVPTTYGVSARPLTEFNAGTSEFRKGWRMEITNPSACSFDVDLEALTAP